MNSNQTKTQDQTQIQTQNQSKAELSAAEKEKLFLDHVHLVKKHARKIAHRISISINVEDLESAGYIGLCSAISRYDPAMPNEFSAFAEPRVRGAIIDEIRSCEWAPRSAVEKTQTINRAREAAEKFAGGPVGAKEIASAMGMTIDEYHEFQASSRRRDAVSLQAPSSKNGSYTVEETLASTPPMQLRGMEVSEVKDLVTQSLDGITESEALVLGMTYIEDVTQKELTSLLGISETRVSKVHADAMENVRKVIEDHLS
jgi:RNA polymerase sigma factor for flagellar operon FliA